MRIGDSQRVNETHGFTLIELLVASAIAILLIGVTVTLFTSLLQSEPRASARSAQIEHGRVMLERITRELRQGFDAEIINSGRTITLSTEVCDADPDGDGVCAVTYDCALETTCTKSGEGSSVEVVQGIDPDETVFELDSAAPSFIEVILTFPDPDGGEAVTLRDGAAMRNYTPEDAGGGT